MIHKSGNMKGIGLTMEAIEQNPVLYELMTAPHLAGQEPINLENGCQQYILNRYGVKNNDALKAWNIFT